MFHRAEIVELDIVDYAFGGKGIARIPSEDGEFIVFVDNAFPGQKVNAKIKKKKKRFAEASLIEVIERSPIEQVNNFQEISGAPYIFVPIEEQEKVKEESTLEVVRRIGGISDPNSLFDEFIS